MISRVGAALAQFIAPVASAQAQDHIRAQDDQRRPPGQKQERKQPPANIPKPELKVAVAPDAKPASGSPASATLPAGAGGAQSFLQLLDVFQHGRGMFMRFFGTRSYNQSIKTQKKAGKFKKGTMLDERVE